LLKTLEEICRYTGNMPSKPKSNFFVVCASKFQSNCGCYAIGVGDNTEDVDAKLVGWIEICPFTSRVHNFGYMKIAQKG
jgi:hypothetical protein